MLKMNDEEVSCSCSFDRGGKHFLMGKIQHITLSCAIDGTADFHEAGLDVFVGMRSMEGRDGKWLDNSPG